MPRRGRVLPALGAAQGNGEGRSWSFPAQRANPSPISAANRWPLGPKKRLRVAAANPGRCLGLGEPLGLRPAEQARVAGRRHTACACYTGRLPLSAPTPCHAEA